MDYGTVAVLARQPFLSGSALRTFSEGEGSAWARFNRQTMVGEIAVRLRNPFVFNQLDKALCGPFAILVEWLRRDPVNFVNSTKQLLETGRFICRTGRVIEADEDLREIPPPATVAQVEWLLAATMRDDENLLEDVDDASEFEGFTAMGAMSSWTKDVLNLTPAELGDPISFDLEMEMLFVAEGHLRAGGLAFLLVDSHMLTPGPDDREEDLYYERFQHYPESPTIVQFPKVHGKDDRWPPNHWVICLGGLNFGRVPEPSEAVSIRLWSWAGEFVVTGAAEAFGEYLYGVVAGGPRN